MKEMIIVRYFDFLFNNDLLKVLAICIVLDTIFGVLRAIKQKKINSNIGIDGIIRKVGMLTSVIFFALIDVILELNLIGFIPDEVRKAINLESVGIASLFNLLFIIFESLSILKNMIKCKLPIPKRLQALLENIFNKFTEELKESGDNK